MRQLRQVEPAGTGDRSRGRFSDVTWSPQPCGVDVHTPEDPGEAGCPPEPPEPMSGSHVRAHSGPRVRADQRHGNSSVSRLASTPKRAFESRRGRGGRSTSLSIGPLWDSVLCGAPGAEGTGREARPLPWQMEAVPGEHGVSVHLHSATADIVSVCARV